MCRRRARRRWMPAFVLALSAAATLHAGPVGRVDLDSLRTPIYTAEGDAFVRHNGDRYCNRPLYCNQTYAAVFAGDRPYILLGSGKTNAGAFMVGLIRNGKGTWLHDASDVTARYRPGRMEWTVKDAAWGDTTVGLRVVPAADGAGMAIRARVDGARPGDALVWASGAATSLRDSVLFHFDVTTAGREPMHMPSFVPGDCAGDEVRVNANGWTLRVGRGKSASTTVGRCSAPTKLTVADASAWSDPAALASVPAKDLPIACGTVALDDARETCWSVRTANSDGTATTAPATPSSPAPSPIDDFAAGLRRVEEVERRVVVDTPDPWLNAAVGASGAVTDGVFRDGIYTHAGMRWGVPLLGWRTMFGGTAYGWHDRVKTEAALAIAHQVTRSDKTIPQPNPAAGLASQGPGSRLFGKGRIDFHQPAHYDMQSQFFDQLVHAWRWTGDAELERLLRPSLDLHLQYIKDCFDPDGDGTYESYANTWPTDDQWYNGGGTSEETAYAYRGERAALLLARRAGDQAGVRAHEAALARIRKGFFDLLWVPAKGHPGAYREQGGLKRLHEDPWLYGIFCPIDAGLLDPEQSAQALRYTEYALERIKLPYGGEQCWPSNWVPSIWSVREMWPGDNYHLALAYFQTGFAEEGWSILRGTFPQLMFFGPVPGDLGHPAGGTDFNDCASMFARTLVEGLFGYSPDYPDGIVRIAPQFPAAWDRASIQTPDVRISYRRQGKTSGYDVTLARPCDVEFRLPASTTAIEQVTVNGHPVTWDLLPGFGRSIVKLTVPPVATADVRVTARDALGTYRAEQVAANSGDHIDLRAKDATIIDFHDPQGVLADARVDDGIVRGTVTANPGDHLVFALAQLGDARQWREFKIRVTDPKADAAAAAMTLPTVPKDARWEPMDLRPILNADVRAVYQQEYLSPRPNTCSLRLATDGYSTWQMVLDPKSKPPAIDLANVSSMLDATGRLVTRDGVAFAWPAGEKNIAFTSGWDNFPKHIDVPVNRSGEAVWFLVCGTTNPMECGIANAEIRMTYADGGVENVELVPPTNFWTLCPLNRFDYNYQRDAFCLPKVPPRTVQLGANCRAILLNRRLRPGAVLERVTLRSLSEQVVIGLMGVTIMNPAR